MSEKSKPGRKSLGDTVHVCIAMPRTLHEQIKAKAAAQEMTASAVARLALRDSLAASAAPTPEGPED